MIQDEAINYVCKNGIESAHDEYGYTDDEYDEEAQREEDEACMIIEDFYDFDD